MLSQRYVVSVGICSLLIFSDLGFTQENLEAEKQIVALYKDGKLFDQNAFREVQKTFTDLFEQRHDSTIRSAYGEDYDKLTSWLNDHPLIKETFYTAINERYDDIEKSLSLFRDLWKAHPKEIEQFGSLAIAVAVTWDNPRRGVYDYAHHQRRTKSVMPDDMVDAMGNFKYLVENQKEMAGRGARLPWEFLLFVIDHRTPIEERKWAQTYFKQWQVRSKAGKARSVHQDIPYDMDMLNGERDKSTNLQPKIKDKDYTLANLKEFGGVCAQQADFAARVGKSVCIPAVYCWGRSAYRGLHAWWMFVQVSKVTSKQLQFRLVSDGRYVGFERDKFYTGYVKDPQTGQQILDRDMERRLWSIGNAPTESRHTRLLMRAYPSLVTTLDMKVKDRVEYLQSCLKLNGVDEEVWQEVARMGRNGELTKEHQRIVGGALVSLIRRFKEYPDFISKLLPDMLQAEISDTQRLKVWQEAEKVFEKAGRADLACAAQLKIADLYIKHEKWQTASKNLTRTILKYPSEGRFVPKLSKKLEEASTNVKNGPTATAKMYLQLIPAMIVHYKGLSNDFCQGIYKQAMAFLSTNNLTKYEQALKLKVESSSLRPRR